MTVLPALKIGEWYSREIYPQTLGSTTNNSQIFFWKHTSTLSKKKHFLAAEVALGEYKNLFWRHAALHWQSGNNLKQKTLTINSGYEKF